MRARQHLAAPNVACDAGDPFVGERRSAAADFGQLVAQGRVAMYAPLEWPILVLALEDRVGPGPPVPARCPLGVLLRVAAGAGSGARRAGGGVREASVNGRQPVWK